MGYRLKGSHAAFTHRFKTPPFSQTGFFMTQHWSINGRFVTQPFSGVQRYANEILRALDDLICEGHELTTGLALELLVPPGAEDLPTLNAITIRQAGKGKGHLWEQTALPRAVRGGLLSLCNTGPIAVGRQIVCIHDINTRMFPESYSFAFRALYRVLPPALGRRVRHITTVSRYSAAQLAAFGVAPSGKILVTPNGHEHALRWEPDHSERIRAAAGSNSVFVLGSPAQHKNVGMLLEMAGEFEKAGLRIAVAGPSDGRVFQLSSQGRDAANVFWLGRISNDEIAAMLSDCLCLAFPSFVEGFGLPAVEAMAWGCPVVASDRTSLPEIGGDAVLYASPDDPGAWLDQILRLHRDQPLRAQLAEKGRQQMKKFSWRSSAKQYLQAMQDAA
jgi:glycosyltransferase involved in cell wall biosynthesis